MNFANFSLFWATKLCFFGAEPSALRFNMMTCIICNHFETFFIKLHLTTFDWSKKFTGQLTSLPSVKSKHSILLTSVQAKTSLPKEYILADKDCFGRIKAVSAGISHFGRTTENNFYRIKCFCRIIGRIIDRLFGRYDIRLPTTGGSPCMEVRVELVGWRLEW